MWGFELVCLRKKFSSIHALRNHRFREQIRKLERDVFYVDDVNPEVGGIIDAMLERRGKVEDKKLSESYNDLREKGTYWVTPERPNPAFDIIKGNIYVSDGKELGIKVLK